MSITKRHFGNLPGGTEISCYTLDNGKGLSAEILDYGCIIKNLYFTDKSGRKLDLVLGRDTLAEYADNDGYFGAVIGRNSNRLAGRKIQIRNKTCILAQNDGQNNLHGGLKGFDKKFWHTEIVDTDGAPSLIMSTFSADGEEGFPGNLDAVVTYSLTKKNSLEICYTAAADWETVINLTNHSYFNLNGHNSGSIYNHELQLNCDYFTPNTAECMPNGEILSVKGTAFDFTKSKSLGEAITAPDCEQLEMFGGYDHNFIINGEGCRKGGSVYCPDSGILMELFTNSPAVQIYTANAVDEQRVCKDKTVYKKHGAICLETQFFPNSFSYPHFIKPIFKAGERFDYVTEYKFSIK